MTLYRSPKLTVDGVLFNKTQLLLVKRKHEPFKEFWALPGGFVDYGETTENAIIREMKEETGLDVKVIDVVGVYSDPDRDPRGHTVSIVYETQQIGGKLMSGDDAAETQFFNHDSLPPLAFDHHEIIKEILRRKK